MHVACVFFRHWLAHLVEGGHLWDARRVYARLHGHVPQCAWQSHDSWWFELRARAARAGKSIILWPWIFNHDGFTRANFGVLRGAQRGDFTVWPLALDVPSAPVFTLSVTNSQDKDAQRLISRHIMDEHKGGAAREVDAEMLVSPGHAHAGEETIRVGVRDWGYAPVLLADIWYLNVTDMPEQRKATQRVGVGSLATNRFTLDHRAQFKNPSDDDWRPPLHHSRLFTDKLRRTAREELATWRQVQGWKKRTDLVARMWGIRDVTRAGDWDPKPISILTPNEGMHLFWLGFLTKALEVHLGYMKKVDPTMVRMRFNMHSTCIRVHVARVRGAGPGRSSSELRVAQRVLAGSSLSQKRKAPSNLGLSDTVGEVLQLGLPVGDDALYVHRHIAEITSLLHKIFVALTHAQGRVVRDLFRQKWPFVRDIFLTHGIDSETVVVHTICPPPPGPPYIMHRSWRTSLR